MTFSLMLLLHNLAHVAPATVAGAFGVLANCLWPLQRERRVVLALQCVGAMMFGLHYLLLGAPTAAALCIGSIVQGVSAATIGNRRLRLSIFGATILAGLGMTVATFAGVTSALAQTGSLLTATGRLQRGVQSIRWCFLAGEVFWTTHNILVGSTWGLTSDTLSVTMLLIGLWRGRRQGGLFPWLAPLRRVVSHGAMVRAVA
jgi:Bacterial inner membrane protein